MGNEQGGWCRNTYSNGKGDSLSLGEQREQLPTQLSSTSITSEWNLPITGPRGTTSVDRSTVNLMQARLYEANLGSREFGQKQASFARHVSSNKDFQLISAYFFLPSVVKESESPELVGGLVGGLMGQSASPPFPIQEFNRASIRVPITSSPPPITNTREEKRSITLTAFTKPQGTC